MGNKNLKNLKNNVNVRSSDKKIIFYFIILLIWEFLTLVLADGFPLESEWS